MAGSAEDSHPPRTPSPADRPAYRGRFAPSPTGPLHFGSLVAALGSYCDARASGGQWLLRIEDVDSPRTRPGAEKLILGTLERYGFEWDGPVARQAERVSLYEAALERLIEAHAVYSCACSRRELQSARPGVGGERVYPGTCRNGIPPDLRSRTQRAWRVRLGDDVTPISFADRLLGKRTQDLACDVGDFVVRRADGLFAYQLAVVVDDAEQGVTDVVRGADLLDSTPRQIHLQTLLGYATPRYLHLPVAVTQEGLKLSKQTLAAPLPADPMQALTLAWRFLAQPTPENDWQPERVAAFWSWALRAWDPARIPPVVQHPAPDAFGSRQRHRP